MAPTREKAGLAWALQKDFRPEIAPLFSVRRLTLQERASEA